MAVPAPAALNKCEAVGVDRRGHSRNVALRKHIRRRMGAWQSRRSPSIRHEPKAWLTTTTAAAARPAPWAEALVYGHMRDRLRGEPLVRGHPSGRVWGRRWRTVGVPSPGSTMTAPPLLGDDDRM
jgi:hypothetical protein